MFYQHQSRMDQVAFNYSMKNIPSKNSHLKRPIEKVESVIKRMRWKAKRNHKALQKPRTCDHHPKQPPHRKLNLTDGSCCPYRQPNNTTQYIDARSNHPPSILKQLPSAINRLISGISCNKKSFDKAKQHYEDALKRSGHTTNFTYMANGTSTPQQSIPLHHRKNRQ